MEAKICPSILSANFATLGEDCKKVIAAGADWIHVDVMDYHFVPNLTIGAPVVSSLHKYIPDAFLDVHLMVENPEKYVVDMAKAGANQFTFHIEATNNSDSLIESIHKAGMRAAIAVKPKTPIDSIYPYLDKVEMILVMTVEPGFGGQKFMADMMPKIQEIRKRNQKIDVQVDGGLNAETVKTCAEAGSNCIVAGSFVFGASDWKVVIDQLRAPFIH